MRVKHAACQTPAVKKQPTIAPEVVTKLESENADLRDKLQELQAQLEAQGGTQKELDEAVNLAAQEKQAREAAEAELDELRTRLAATVRLEGVSMCRGRAHRSPPCAENAGTRGRATKAAGAQPQGTSEEPAAGYHAHPSSRTGGACACQQLGAGRNAGRNQGTPPPPRSAQELLGDGV